ncbi:PBSX family phage terminase large subunit [Phenylobacterium immobile]|uniref:PBSX family phage terminase large subunit n=1 Tax=Phenylobacterium immobile TaxID=21 RepID=UPI000AC46EC3|nr:PBSX family phage terminase large subunit [Phenylobacterium immobile]
MLKRGHAPAFKPLLEPARYKGAYGGRGSGKSHFFAEELVLRCVDDPTMRVVCVREVQRSLDQSVKKLLEDKIEAMGFGACFEVRAGEIRVLDERGRKRGLIIFQGMQDHTAASIKSLEGYRIAWVEEAQSLSKRSLELLTPTLRAPGAEIWFSWNPDLPSDPVDAFMRGPGVADDPEVICVGVTYNDNPWFRDTSLLADKARDQRRDPDKYKHVWLGGYDDKGEARVFRNWTVREFEAPAGAQHRLGADWGFATDPTVLVRCHLEARQLFVDYEAWLVGCEIDHTPALFDSVPESRRFFITADSARPELVSYMQRSGFPKIVAAIKGPGSLEDGIEFLKSYDIVVHPRCKHVIEELSTYSYRTDRQSGAILSELEDRRNHTIDALRYACEGARRAGPVRPPKRERREAMGAQGWMAG